MNEKIYIFDKGEFSSPAARRAYVATMIFITVLFNAMFLMSGGWLIYEHSYLVGVLMIAVPLLVTAALYAAYNSLKKAYVLFEDERAEEHTFLLLREKVRVFNYNEIKRVQLMHAMSFSFKLKGIRLRNQQYYVFLNGKDKYLFKIAKTSASDDAVKKLLRKLNLDIETVG